MWARAGSQAGIRWQTGGHAHRGRGARGEGMCTGSLSKAQRGARDWQGKGRALGQWQGVRSGSDTQEGTRAALKGEGLLRPRASARSAFRTHAPACKRGLDLDSGLHNPYGRAILPASQPQAGLAHPAHTWSALGPFLRLEGEGLSAEGRFGGWPTSGLGEVAWPCTLGCKGISGAAYRQKGGGCRGTSCEEHRVFVGIAPTGGALAAEAHRGGGGHGQSVTHRGSACNACRREEGEGGGWVLLKNGSNCAHGPQTRRVGARKRLQTCLHALPAASAGGAGRLLRLQPRPLPWCHAASGHAT